uniref:Gamma-glutamylcyclotransferase family protein n=1 Tax=Elaeophora elaphi TaxID=1147741 RepID=A0A0R3RRB8_9BILA
MSNGTKAKIARGVLLFIYGTLKRGEPNAPIMADVVTGMQRFVGTGKTVNAFPLIIASEYNIPFCLDKPGIGNRITGELYEVDEQKLKVLDEFEGHPTFYRRQSKEVEMDHNGTIVTAWIYMLPKWTPSLLQSSTNYLETYNSKGSHNRPYIKRLKGYETLG